MAVGERPASRSTAGRGRRACSSTGLVSFCVWLNLVAGRTAAAVGTRGRQRRGWAPRSTVKKYSQARGELPARARGTTLARPATRPHSRFPSWPAADPTKVGVPLGLPRGDLQGSAAPRRGRPSASKGRSRRAVERRDPQPAARAASAAPLSPCWALTGRVPPRCALLPPAPPGAHGPAGSAAPAAQRASRRVPRPGGAGGHAGAAPAMGSDRRRRRRRRPLPGGGAALIARLGAGHHGGRAFLGALPALRSCVTGDWSAVGGVGAPLPTLLPAQGCGDDRLLLCLVH